MDAAASREELHSINRVAHLGLGGDGRTEL
jgi:hypothetical protein